MFQIETVTAVITQLYNI